MIPRQKKGRLAAGNNEPFIEDPKHIYSMVVFLPSSQAVRANPMPASSSEETDETGEESSRAPLPVPEPPAARARVEPADRHGRKWQWYGRNGRNRRRRHGTGGTTGKPSGGTGTGTGGTSKQGG